jgi:hypothetical protein
MQDKKINDSSQQHNDIPVGQTPLDPTDNAQGLMNDTSGLTGISKDTNNPNTPPHNNSPISQSMSDVNYSSALSAAAGTDDDEQSPPDSSSNTVSTPGSIPTGNEELDNASADESGEQSVSGDMPDPASDDDTLENAHAVGLRLNEDEEHPQELDIASDLDKAEEYQRTH